MTQRACLILVIFLLVVLSVQASNKVSASVTIDATSGGVALPSSLIAPTSSGQQKFCMGRLETAEIRYWTSGSAPTSSVGIPLEPAEILTITGYESMLAFRGIRTTGTSGVMRMECWR